MVSRDLWRTSVTPHKASTSPEVSTSQPSTRTSSGISPPPKAYGWVEAVGAIWASCRPVPQVRFRWCECWKWTVNESNILLEVRLAHCLNFWFFLLFLPWYLFVRELFFFFLLLSSSRWDYSCRLTLGYAKASTTNTACSSLSKYRTHGIFMVTKDRMLEGCHLFRSWYSVLSPGFR